MLSCLRDLEFVCVRGSERKHGFEKTIIFLCLKGRVREQRGEGALKFSEVLKS